MIVDIVLWYLAIGFLVASVKTPVPDTITTWKQFRDVFVEYAGNIALYVPFWLLIFILYVNARWYMRKEHRKWSTSRE